MIKDDTICAVSTPSGTGAISIIRLSGPETLKIVSKAWSLKNRETDFSSLESRHSYLGEIRLEEGTLLDEAMLVLFRSPESYTTEDVAEFYCHGSEYIQSQLMQLLIRHGARTAEPGEFTFRAFMNGRIDLPQAEAVADLIASGSQMAHKIAIQQMRGGFSTEIKELRGKLLNFSSLLELELDFSEEDVEFADRNKLNELLESIQEHIKSLLESYKLGNILKSGIPVTIAGRPNVGKSTLLNILLNEDKAIVTDIPGTTRDVIEDTMVINGFTFRFIDTAGLRVSTDVIENLGIEKTLEKIENASVIIYMFDITESTVGEVKKALEDFHEKHVGSKKKLIAVANKMDMLVESPRDLKKLMDFDPVYISAKRKENINLITERLVSFAKDEIPAEEGSIISSSRHYEALLKAKEEIDQAQKGIVKQTPTDLIASDIRNALYHLAVITGEINTEEILGNIFNKFCIGK